LGIQGVGRGVHALGVFVGVIDTCPVGLGVAVETIAGVLVGVGLITGVSCGGVGVAWQYGWVIPIQFVPYPDGHDNNTLQVGLCGGVGNGIPHVKLFGISLLRQSETVGFVFGLQ